MLSFLQSVIIISRISGAKIHNKTEIEKFFAEKTAKAGLDRDAMAA